MMEILGLGISMQYCHVSAPYVMGAYGATRAWAPPACPPASALQAVATALSTPAGTAAGRT